MRILLILLLAGCSHATVDASSRPSTRRTVPSSGTTVISGQTGVHVQSNALAAVILSGMFLAAAADDAREPRSFPSFSVFSDWLRPTPASQLDPDRRISEQDCSRPIDHTLGNIRCK